MQQHDRRILRERERAHRGHRLMHQAAVHAVHHLMMRRRAARHVHQDRKQHQARAVGRSHQERPQRKLIPLDAHRDPSRMRARPKIAKDAERYQDGSAGLAQQRRRGGEPRPSDQCDHGGDRNQMPECDRPERGEDLGAACEALARDDTVWVVILRGAGDRAFCAGADLKARRDFTPEDWAAQRELFRGMFARLRGVPQPMIAAVHGFALGGGTELAMLSDFVVASYDAVFGLTEVILGIIPVGGGTQNLPRLICRNRAKELIYSARRIGAREAHELGLVNHVVTRTALLPKAIALAEEIMKNSPFAVRQTKWAIDRGADSAFEDGLQREHEAYMRAIASDDRREGIAAFNEKRPPRFSGR